MRYDRSRAVLLTALTLLSVSCAKGGDSADPAAGAATAEAATPAVLEVAAHDFAFRTARSTPAGVTTIRLKNDGPELHHVQLVRLAAGHTVDELVSAMKTQGERLPEWATLAGGPNSPAPGGTSETTVVLQAGQYAVICVIPSADGVPHVMKGMIAPLTVTAASGAAPVAEPAADVHVTLTDYAFAVTPTLSAGKHVLRVENTASQPHEVFFVKLVEGKGAPDMVNWIEKPQGPPPGQPVGGTSTFATGEVNFVSLDLAPGRYGLYCFAPDAKDGLPHVAHGMMQEITVQ
jgi:uncharacterized cupredoxin-like copper-binding protein